MSLRSLGGCFNHQNQQLSERTYILFKSYHCGIRLFPFPVKTAITLGWANTRDRPVRAAGETSAGQSMISRRQGDGPSESLLPSPADERMRPEEEAVALLVRPRPNCMATNELPITRIYCLVLSQELIKSTQLKAAMRKTSAVNGAFIQLIHDCQLK